MDLFPVTGFEIITNITVALVCGLFISWLYRHTYKGPGYSITFVNSMVFLAMITAVVILVIGNNLARAFGLVGAMSIIRFRTAVKETQDIVYIFFALSVGMAAGVGTCSLDPTCRRHARTNTSCSSPIARMATSGPPTCRFSASTASVTR